MGLILTDIKTSFGKYIDAGQGEKDVHNAFMYPENKLLSIFQTIETKDTQVRAGLMTTSRVAQAFKNKFSALGNSEFKPHVIDLFKHKMDVLLTPDDVENSWLGFLAGPGLNRDEWPIGKYIAMELMKRYQFDIELDERVKGVYVAPVDDETPAAAGTAMNGLRKIFTDHVTAGLITPYASGALSNTAATFVQQVEGFVKSIAQKERQYVKAVVLPMNKKDLYKEGMQSLYNQNYLSEADILKVRNNPGIVVMFTESSDGTNLMWATMDGNARRYVKREAKNYLMGVKDLRQLQVTTDHWEGLGFVVPQFAYVNDAGIIV